jgi:trans-aconitate 3-methyltransferase
MNNTNPKPSPQDPVFADPTFRTNTTKAAEAYQAGRPDYADVLMNELFTHHTRTGGKLTTLLDVGCGPGTATRSLSPHFHAAYGCDPSDSMISTAQGIPSTTLSGIPVSYAVGAAESLDTVSFSPNSQPLSRGSVDLITCAMSAHWFSPIRSFYEAAASLLAPGGTLAMWTASSLYCNPHTTPNSTKVQAILFDLERNILAPFELLGNRLSMDGYDDLPLPWDEGVPSFDEATFVRREWNKGGKVEKGETFLGAEPRRSLNELAKGCSTASMVVRWREANREALEKGEVEDCVDLTIKRLKEVLGGQDWLEGGPSTVLLMIKKT